MKKFLSLERMKGAKIKVRGIAEARISMECMLEQTEQTLAFSLALLRLQHAISLSGKPYAFTLWKNCMRANESMRSN